MFRALALALLLALPACRTDRHADWAKVCETRASWANDLKLPVLIPDTMLKNFLPERLDGRLGESPLGTMTRMGDRALSEATRSYRGGPPGDTGRVEIKIADAWLEPRATQAIRSLASTDAVVAGRLEALGAWSERLVLPGGIGYARYDEGERLAQAQALIGDRFIASATVAQAADAQDAAQVLRALDTLALAHLAQAQ